MMYILSIQVGLLGEEPALAADVEVGVWPGLNWSPDPIPTDEPLVWYKVIRRFEPYTLNYRSAHV